MPEQFVLLVWWCLFLCHWPSAQWRSIRVVDPSSPRDSAGEMEQWKWWVWIAHTHIDISYSISDDTRSSDCRLHLNNAEPRTEGYICISLDLNATCRGNNIHARSANLTEIRASLLAIFEATSLSCFRSSIYSIKAMCRKKRKKEMRDASSPLHPYFVDAIHVNIPKHLECVRTSSLRSARIIHA